ncbi:MAG TPA: UxaA family hydrolase, partial [Opitutaceae bacterium]
IFVTGNGSITNFPFVPTLKITTTSRRHQLLIHEMDINAGRYLDGEPFAAVAADAFELLVATASGQKTKGEHAGHSQVSLWRNWRQTDTSNLAALRARVAPSGIPLIGSGGRPDRHPMPATTERVALILPTSMCSTQIARLAADRLNATPLAREHGLSRFVAFTHSEGCGFGGETMYRLLERTYRGYLTHPNVAAALLLEHGCEKIPNDTMRRQLEAAAIPLDRYGWASVQLDGGIEKAITKIGAWFSDRLAQLPPAAPTADPAALTFALLAAGPVAPTTAAALAELARHTLAAGGSIVLAEGDPLLAAPAFRTAVLGDTPLHATLAYGQPIAIPGLHLVASETDHWVENITGFAANGAHLALGVVGTHAQQGHPLIPVLQFADPAQRGHIPADDIDAFFTGDVTNDTALLSTVIAAAVRREKMPVATATGFVDFQLTRGLLGLTT